MLEMMDAIYEEVVMLVALGAGSALFAYFKKLHSTQKSLCEQVSKLQKTIIILAKAVASSLNSYLPIFLILY